MLDFVSEYFETFHLYSQRIFVYTYIMMILLGFNIRIILVLLKWIEKGALMYFLKEFVKDW